MLNLFTTQSDLARAVMIRHGFLSVLYLLPKRNAHAILDQNEKPFHEIVKKVCANQNMRICSILRNKR